MEKSYENPATAPVASSPEEEYGLIGYPLGHSFSARFFAEKFEKEQRSTTYQNFEIPEAETLKEIIRQHPKLKGVNVTIPHKQAVMPLLDALSDEAKAIGAVNVIQIRHTEAGGILLKGYNSDVIGFCDSLRPLLKPYHTHALVLGTGGASKAVVYGLKRMGITPLYVSRTPHPGRLTYQNLTEKVLQQNLLIVNCSPVGMYPHVDECPDIPYEYLSSRHLLFDLVYNPLETLFLKKGREMGATTQNGLEMLHLQALASWDFWHEK